MLTIIKLKFEKENSYYFFESIYHSNIIRKMMIYLITTKTD